MKVMTNSIEIILILQEHSILMDPLLITASMVGSICTWEIIKTWNTIKTLKKEKEKQD